MSAPRAIAGGIYYLSGVLVKAETKEVAKKLIAKGFRTATDGIKNSGLKVQTVTNSNFVTFVTRALKKAIEQNKKIRQGPKIDPKTGRPVGRKSPEEGNLLGNRGHSEFARKYGNRKMGGFGPVKSTRVKEAKDLKLAQGKRAKAKAESSALKLTNAQRVYKSSAKSSEVAGNRSNFTPTIVVTSPLSSSADEASSKIPSVQTKARKTSTQVQRSANADTAAKRKDNLKKLTKERNLENKRGFKPETKKETKKEPVRPKLRPKVVEAKPMSLRSYLNAEIKSRKSTVAKEKAKARKGDYKNIAEAKKAKSLYYIKDGKPMAAVYKRDLKGL